MLPAEFRILALSEGLSACAPDEAPALASALVELAALSTSPAGSPLNWWAKVRLLLSLYTRPPIAVADSALIALLRCWDRLPEASRERTQNLAIGRFDLAGSAAICTARTGEKIAVAQAAQDIVTTELAATVVTLLGDQNSRVVTAAERALISLANAFTLEYGPTRTLAEGDEHRNGLCNEVARALDVAPIDSKAPYSAALLLLDPATIRSGSALAEWLKNSKTDQSRLRSSLRARTSLVSRLRAWQWLYLPGLRDSALDRLADTPSAAEHNPILERGHLVLRPARAAAAKSLGAKVDSILPPPSSMAGLSKEGFSGLALIAQHIRPGDGYMQELTIRAVADADTPTRRRIMSSAAAQNLHDLMYDPSEAVARGAILRWSTSGIGQMHSSNVRQATRLIRSPHESVRTIAQQELNRMGGGDPDSTPGRAFAWQVLTRNRPEILSQIRAGLRSVVSEEQMRALQLMRRMNLAGEFPVELEELARMGVADASGPRERALEPRVLATVLSMLRSNQRAIPALLLASDSSDARIRANAMESLLHLMPHDISAGPATETYGRAIERCEDESARVRANSIRGLLTSSRSVFEAKPMRMYEPHAVSSLLKMLHDERPVHRLSGVWAAERVLTGTGRSQIGDAWGEISGTLVQLAQGDDQSHVRRRAAAAARRMAAELKAEAAGAMEEVA